MYENAKYCMLLSLASGEYFLVYKIRRTNDVKVLTHPINGDLIKHMVIENICRNCPNYWKNSYVYWYRLCNGCPASETIRLVEDNHNLMRIDLDWISGKLQAGVKMVTYSEDRKDIIDKS